MERGSEILTIHLFLLHLDLASTHLVTHARVTYEEGKVVRIYLGFSHAKTILPLSCPSYVSVAIRTPLQNCTFPVGFSVFPLTRVCRTRWPLANPLALLNCTVEVMA